MDVSTTLPSEAFFLYYSSIYQRIDHPFRAFHLVDLLLSTHTACINVRVHVVLLYISTLTLLSLYPYFTLTLPVMYSVIIFSSCPPTFPNSSSELARLKNYQYLPLL